MADTRGDFYSNLAVQLDLRQFASYLSEAQKQAYRKHLDASYDVSSRKSCKTKDIRLKGALSYAILVLRLDMKTLCRYLSREQVKELKSLL